MDHIGRSSVARNGTFVGIHTTVASHIIADLLGPRYGNQSHVAESKAKHRLIWAIPAGLLLGFFLGKWIGHFAIRLRNLNPHTGAPDDFLALALIALAYASAEASGAWGFLVVFAAGLGFRQTEFFITKKNPEPQE